MGEELYALFRNPDTDPNELARVACRTPYYRNYYFNTLWSVLFGRPTLEPTYYDSLIDEYHQLKLAAAVHERFVYIGMYPHFKETASAIAHLLDFTFDPEAEIVHVQNGSEKPALSAETMTLLHEVNADEYRLLSLIHTPEVVETGLARAASLRLDSDSTHAQVERLNERVRELEIACARQAADARDAHSQLAALRMSRSWRLTAPMRAILRRLRSDA
ncbi:hypothetical protein D7S86_25005 [Pararobbsia silviterrae]|uniref:Uncharacterized protein n=2 Tax=Pararobbsia silviterrae TaxID=1792498 RepID=A0A494X7B8_9BURK|nr:hypothetical protein D7S86_25005 [Pararobbsia silviterrae]